MVGYVGCDISLSRERKYEQDINKIAAKIQNVVVRHGT